MATATITFTVVFGSTPTSVVSCAIETPVGILDVFVFGTDPQVASGGDGVTFTCTVPYTSPATADTPYKAYWLPGKIAQTFPTQAVVTQSPPPPTPPPALTASLTDSAEPGLLTPGISESGDQ